MLLEGGAPAAPRVPLKLGPGLEMVPLAAGMPEGVRDGAAEELGMTLKAGTLEAAAEPDTAAAEVRVRGALVAAAETAALLLG